MIDSSFMRSVINCDINYWYYMRDIKNSLNLIFQKERDNKVIGSSLDLEIDFYGDEKNLMALHRIGDEGRFFFGVSRADFHSDRGIPETAKEMTVPGLWVSVMVSVNPKCERCWNRRPEIGLDKNHSTICYRCIDNMSNIGEVRKYV